MAKGKTKGNNEKKLTAKQRLFVKEFLVDLNATGAARRAGYSLKTAEAIGFENLRKPKIADALQEEMDKRAARAGINADYVFETIIDTIERCRQHKPVTLRNGDPVLVETPDGVMTPAYTFDSSAVLKGCELLGKHLKLFTDKHEHAGPNGGPIENKWIVEIRDAKNNAQD